MQAETEAGTTTTFDDFSSRRRAQMMKRELARDVQQGDGRPKNNGVAPGPVSQRQAAAEAGLSKRQEKDAVRVAQVPAADFEGAVESESPPSVTALAKQGKKPGRPLVDLEGRDSEEFKLATHALGALRCLVEFAQRAALVEPIAHPVTHLNASAPLASLEERLAMQDAEEELEHGATQGERWSRICEEGFVE